jgi:hypothetical protein
MPTTVCVPQDGHNSTFESTNAPSALTLRLDSMLVH